MHQITLLGGLGTAQHADSSHFLRPDRVYRTSVLSPMTGFQPGQAVMATARDFTMGPYSGMSLNGPRWFPRVRAWWAGVKMRARAGGGPMMMLPPSAIPSTSIPTASEKQVHAPGSSLPPTAHGHGYGLLHHGGNSAPMIVTADVVGPFGRGIPQDMVARAYGQSPSLPPFAAEAASKTSMMMWRGLRWPWH